MGLTVNMHTQRKIIMTKIYELKYPELTAKTIKIGDRYQNNKESWYTVMNYLGDNLYSISFDNGVSNTATVDSMRKGKPSNPYDNLLCGVGYLGEGVFAPTVKGKKTKLYSAWSNMIKRCYYEGERTKAYQGCTVHPWWHNFQHFAADVHYLDGFEDWYENDIPHAWALDKDIILPGNKEYGPDACKFVSQSENNKHTGKWYE